MSADQNTAPQATAPARFAQLGLGAIALIAANSGLIALYFLLDLELVQLVVVYWVECLWIGIFTVLKLLTASLIGSPYENRYVSFSRGGAVLTSLLTIGFIGGQFLALFAGTGLAIYLVVESLDPQASSRNVFAGLILLLQCSLLFLVSHAISFVANFLVGGEYKTARATMLLAVPFSRCLALLGAVIVALVALRVIPALASTGAFALLLIVFKLAWDLHLHNGERSRFGAAGDG
ncbi:MAG: DUF6498-containing protein [Pseudomonadota bacterium]